MSNESSKVLVYFDDIISTINPNIYGQQVENYFKGWLDGLYVGTDSSIPNIKGFRKDVINALKKLNIPTMRWGGCFMGSYNWKDGIGPQEKRPKRLGCWGEESNEFGTDEFTEFCRLIGAEPMICMNVTEPLRDACAWIEYCNYPENTYYANLRKENGHSQPYNVRYWEIGNEVWSCGGPFSPEQYAQVYYKFAWYITERIVQWLPVKFPPMKFLADGGGGRGSDWNKRFLESLSNLGGAGNPWTRLIDYLVIHFYLGGRDKFSSKLYYDLLSQISTVEDQIILVSHLLDYYGRRSSEPKNLGIIVNEWGINYPEIDTLKDVNVQPYEEKAQFMTALVSACIYNMFNNHCKKVFMTSPWMLVNLGMALTFAKEDRIVITPLYHVCDMYKDHMGNYALNVMVDSPTLKEAIKRNPPTRGPLGAKAPEELTITREIKNLSVSASKSKDGNSLFITIVNKHPEESIEIEVSIPGIRMRDAKARILTADLLAFNDLENPERVIPRDAKVTVMKDKLSYNAEPKSVNAIKIIIEN